MIQHHGTPPSNDRNQVNLKRLDQGLEFSKHMVQPAASDSAALQACPVGKISNLLTAEGPLSESQFVLESLEAGPALSPLLSRVACTRPFSKEWWEPSSACLFGCPQGIAVHAANLINRVQNRPFVPGGGLNEARSRKAAAPPLFMRWPQVGAGKLPHARTKLKPGQAICSRGIQ